MSVVYISHRLNDVLQIADTVSVLRDGRVVASAPAAEFSSDDLVTLMAGGVLDPSDKPKAAGQAGPVMIRADAVTTPDLPHPITLSARAGEIVGLAGLAGAGRSQLLHAMFGLEPLTGGAVTRCSDGTDVSIGSAATAVRSGMALVGEDRQSMGLFNGQSVGVNMMIPGTRKRTSLFAAIDGKHEREACESLIARLGINCRSPEQDIAELSGGNQQKALIGRWLYAGSDVYLLDEPTRGVDIGTKQALYDRFHELAGLGRCLIIASSELEELMTVCDRIVVLSARKIAAEFTREAFAEEAILNAAFSAHSQPAVRH